MMLNEENRYIQGAVSEINRQMNELRKRKEKLLKEEENTLMAGRTTYADYLKSYENPRAIIENPRVVYQGEPGAYSEMAARDFFGKNVNAKGLYHFDDTFYALEKGEADYAILPIENSSTGAIRQVYDLLAKYNYYFVGETTVKVRHNLMVLPGTKMEEIRTVYSHEQGLFQCERFLAQHPDWRKIAQADTAGSAKMVAEKGDRTKAAICSALAAEIYGLEIIEEGVNENKNNTTRFVVVSPKPELRDGRDKVCISLTTAHESGSLHDILAIFATYGINMVRLESRPIPERKWEYMFFIEFTGDLRSPQIDRAIHEIALTATDMRVLGNFHANLK